MAESSGDSSLEMLDIGQAPQSPPRPAADGEGSGPAEGAAPAATDDPEQDAPGTGLVARLVEGIRARWKRAGKPASDKEGNLPAKGSERPPAAKESQPGGEKPAREAPRVSPEPSADAEGSGRNRAAALWVAVAALMVAVGVGGALLGYRLTEDRRAAVLQQQEELLRSQAAELERLRARNAALQQAKREAEPRLQPGRPAPRKAEGSATDCTVTGNKENVADALRNCIEAYNRAGGR